MYTAVILVTILCCAYGSRLGDSNEDGIGWLEKAVSGLQMLQHKQDIYIQNMEEKLMSQEKLLHSNQRQIQDLERNLISLQRNKRYPKYTTKCQCDGEVGSQHVLKNEQRTIHENDTLVGVKSPSRNLSSTRDEIDLNGRRSRTKRLLMPVSNTQTRAAFSAYMSANEPNPSNDHILVFRSVLTNIGNHYNHHNGMFTAPDHGVYVFTWTIVIEDGKYIRTEILVDSHTVGTMYTSAYGVSNPRTTNEVVVVEVNAGDVVFIRTNTNGPITGDILSIPSDLRTTFSGWKLF